MGTVHWEMKKTKISMNEICINYNFKVALSHIELNKFFAPGDNRRRKAGNNACGASGADCSAHCE